VTPSESDGYPTDLLFPERPRPDHASRRNGDHALDAHAGRQLGDATIGSRDYVYPLEQWAATLWDHDHRTDFTGPQYTR
jgi:spore coat protein A, manganese oxidase